MNTEQECNLKWFEEKLIQRTMDRLLRNRFSAFFAADKQKLFSHLEQLIPKEAVVGSGDSLTLDQLNVFQWLRDNDYNFLDKFDNNLSGAERRSLYRQCFSADVFISGVNAITEQGEIHNLDGNGNRIAPIIFGPDKVILIAGKNKIVSCEDAAIERVRRYAAPIDAYRLGKNTPCTKTGKCVDCRVDERICNYYSILKGQFDSNRIHVVIVGLDLGY